MNNARRKRLEMAQEYIYMAKDIINDVALEERDAFDNMPEGLQTSERGEQIEENADNLDEYAETLYDIYYDLESIIEV